MNQSFTGCHSLWKWKQMEWDFSPLWLSSISIKPSLVQIVSKNTKRSWGETVAQHWYALIRCFVSSTTSISINQIIAMQWQRSCSLKTQYELYMRKGSCCKGFVSTGRNVVQGNKVHNKGMACCKRGRNEFNGHIGLVASYKAAIQHIELRLLQKLAVLYER